jgi:hypothetical protein
MIRTVRDRVLVLQCKAVMLPVSVCDWGEEGEVRRHPAHARYGERGTKNNELLKKEMTIIRPHHVHHHNMYQLST